MQIQSLDRNRVPALIVKKREELPENQNKLEFEAPFLEISEGETVPFWLQDVKRQCELLIRYEWIRDGHMIVSVDGTMIGSCQTEKGELHRSEKLAMNIEAGTKILLELHMMRGQARLCEIRLDYDPEG